jgi:uncharacterized protein (DUF2126 family)
MLLPSQLWADLSQVLADLEAGGLGLESDVFQEIWAWRFPPLLQWRDPTSGAALELRQALEPWPLICDTPREGGHTSRFVDASLRRFEVTTNASFRQTYQLRLQGRLLALPTDRELPLAVRWREQRLYPCLHPGIPPEGPLVLAIEHENSSSHWVLEPGAPRFLPLAPGTCTPEAPANSTAPWQHADAMDICSVDLRQGHLRNNGHPPDISPY